MTKNYLNSLKKELKYWLEMKPVNWIGNMARKHKIDTLNDKIKNIEYAQIETKEEPQEKGSGKESEYKSSAERNAKINE